MRALIDLERTQNSLTLSDVRAMMTVRKERYELARTTRRRSGYPGWQTGCAWNATPGLTHEDIHACPSYASNALRAEKVYPLKVA